MSRASFDVCFDASKKEVQRGPHFRVDDFSIDICCEVKSNSVSITVRSDRHSCWVDVDLFEAHLIVVPMQKIFSERYPINKMKESYFYIEKSDIPNPNGIFSIRFTLALKSKLREEIQTGNRQFCDFVLVSERQEFPVHRILLAAQSPVFKRMFEAKLQDAQTGRADIADVGPKTLASIITFAETNEVADEDLVELLEASKKYEMANLFEKCEAKLSKSVNAGNAASLYHVAKLNNADMLMDAAHLFMSMHMSEVMETEDFRSVREYSEPLTELLSRIRLLI